MISSRSVRSRSGSRGCAAACSAAASTSGGKPSGTSAAARMLAKPQSQVVRHDGRQAELAGGHGPKPSGTVRLIRGIVEAG